MEKFVDPTPWGRVDEYEITDEFPAGYIVWNIGRANFKHEGFIPLVKPDPHFEFGVLVKDMKALKCSSEDEALYILKRASSGNYRKKRPSDGINREIFEELKREFYGNISAN